MAGKRPLRLKLRIPPYVSGDRYKWRDLIQTAVRKAKLRSGVSYKGTDQLEIKMILYFDTEEDLFFHDVDNRLKDLMDALQGRVGGPKSDNPKKRIIRNDSQIFKVAVEKIHSPVQSRGEGHLTIMRYAGPQTRRRSYQLAKSQALRGLKGSP